MAINRETEARKVEEFHGASGFSWNRKPAAASPKLTRIQYSREDDKIHTLMTALGVSSAKAVGEAAFDMIYEEQSEQNV